MMMIQHIIITVLLLLLIIAAPVHSFQAQISPSISQSNAALYYNSPANEESNNGEQQQEATEDNCDLFLSQMASNINQKVQESHPAIMKTETMDSLDTKAKMKQWAGNYDKEAMRSKLENRIANSPVFLLMYGTCPYCAKVIEVLKDYVAHGSAERRKMLIVDLDSLGIEKYALRTEVMELVRHNTIPALWVGGQFVGGYEQVQALQDVDGMDEFQQMLEQAMEMIGPKSS